MPRTTTPTAPTPPAATVRRFGTRAPLRLALAGLALAAAGCAAPPGGSPSSPLGFFVTSVGSGRGGDLGGLAGADAHCETLAAAVGAGGKGWRAYLSTQGPGAVNARDRIGSGPWRNAKGEVVAANLETLHGTNNLNKQTALNEKGEVVPGRGDPVNMHDILTGSNTDGRVLPTNADMSCGNWTSSSAGVAMVGHHDRTGLDTSPPALSWNASHPTRGCSPDALKSTGGNGLFYCFATR